MKRILFALSSALFVASCGIESLTEKLSISTAPTAAVGTQNSASLASSGVIKNATTQTLTVKYVATKTQVGCWTSSLKANGTISSSLTNTFTLDAGATSSFEAIFFPNGSPGKGLYVVSVFVVGDSANTVKTLNLEANTGTLTSDICKLYISTAPNVAVGTKASTNLTSSGVIKNASTQTLTMKYVATKTQVGDCWTSSLKVNGVTASPLTNTFTLNAGATSSFEALFSPNGGPGKGLYVVKVFVVGDSANTVKTLNLEANTGTFALDICKPNGSGKASLNEILVIGKIKNFLSTPQVIRWTYGNEVIPPGWGVIGVCDLNQCYSVASVKTQVVTIPANGESLLKWQVEPSGVLGIGNCTLDVQVEGNTASKQTYLYSATAN